MTIRTTRVLGAAVIGVAGLTVAGTAVAMPGPESPQPPSDRAAEKTPSNRPPRDQVRRRLRAELENSRDRLDEAIRRLDEGGDPARIREELERATPRANRPGRAGRADGPAREFRPLDDRSPVRPLPGDATFDLSPEERARMLTFLDEHAPRVGLRFRELDRTTPDLVTRLLTRMRPRVREVMQTGASDPKGRDLRVAEFRASLDVMWARRELDGALALHDQGAVRAARDELSTALGAHFDAQSALQEHEIDRLAQRVERLRKDLNDRRAQRAEIVEREMSDRWRPGRGEHESDRSGDERPRE